MKAVLFATGTAEHATREAAALQARLGAESVRVVATREMAKRLSAGDCKVVEVGVASFPLTIARLWLFVGMSPTEVFCLSESPEGVKVYRSLKLLAYFVSGRVTFLRDSGPATLGFLAFLWFTLGRVWARQNGAMLVGSAAPETLARLEADLRIRRPDAEVHVLRDPGAMDLLRVAAHWRSYRYLSIPWTGERHNLLKVTAWLLPCGRREIYNEMGDSFSVRRVHVLLAHIARRIYNRILDAWYALRRIPQGVTVMGSASGYYLKDIVATLRQKRPGEPIYGLLPNRLVGPAGHLFDGLVEMRAGAILGHAFGKNRTGHYVIPCTNEGYNRYKLLGSILPLGAREIYNENADGYPVRWWRMLVRHGLWRLRHRLFYQALTERRGRSWLILAMHLLLYPFRLLAGAFVLAGVRLRAHASQPLPDTQVRSPRTRAQTVAGTVAETVAQPGPPSS